ncbi:tetratricopeptide repeat protein [Flagellimonas lutaonensis]|uniref:Tetratricopeptide TPR_1 repeat-containing protein n=1 Tax=Flagellimonas lutaonensis TaxID=516051 RepID=A0A0D5YSR1_9FLAO|nr:tetratricopeptide repeat protein [Allomuricauda lutaonensis]AKA35352.1 Tetratricopeptide TPR_1 repeat-containing protein [Allomuricauda lutaonensis]
MLRIGQIIFIGIWCLVSSAQSSNTGKADSLYAVGSFSAAINAYVKEGSEKAQLQIARAYNALGNYDKAIVQYQEVLSKKPMLAIARFELGKLLLKTKKLGAAYEHFTFLAEDADNPEYHYYLGRIKQLSGDPVAANVDFRKAVKIDSTHLKSIFALGKFFVAAKQKDSALYYIDRGLLFYENDVSMINLKALAFFNNGQYDKAVPYFERLLELGEEKPFVHNKLAFAYLRDWQFEKAKKMYHRLVNTPNHEAQGYSGLGDVFLKEKELDSAQFYIEKYIKALTVSFEMEYADLGRIARLRGNTKKAIELYTKAWEENKQNPMFYYQVCTLVDEYYNDPQMKLRYYQKLLTDFDNLMPFIKERAQKRVKELKEEIHFTTD